MLTSGQPAPLSIRSRPGRRSYLNGGLFSYSPLHGRVSGIAMLTTSTISASRFITPRGGRRVAVVRTKRTRRQSSFDISSLEMASLRILCWLICGRYGNQSDYLLSKGLTDRLHSNLPS